MTKEYYCRLYFKSEFETTIVKLIVELRQLNFDFWFSRKENNIFCFNFTDHNEAAQAELIANVHCCLSKVKLGDNK